MKSRFSSFIAVAVIVILILVISLQCFAAGDVLQRKGFKAGSSGVTSVGPIEVSNIPIINETTAARTVGATDYGKTIICSYAGATTITLPDPVAGLIGKTLFVVEAVDQALTVVGGSTANNNQIIADGVLTSDNIAFSTSAHKIGAMCRITCISATKWLITNASSCAMAVEAAD